MSLTQLSATRLASLIARRQVSAVEVMDAFVHRISQVDPVLKALVAQRFDAAALVAAEGCAFDVGSDTRGSLRWPAHCCGIAALKPTQGMVSRAGHEPPPGMGVLDRLTHIGPLSRHVEDLELLTSLMAGPDRHDALVVPLPEQSFGPVSLDGLRVGVGSGTGVLHPDPVTRSALEACAAALAHRGVEVDAVDLQPHLNRANTLYAELAAADGGAWILRRLAAAGTPLEQAHPWVRNRIQPGRARSAVELAMIVEAIDALCVEMAVAHTSFDVLLTPVFPGPACVPGAWLELVSSGAAGYTSIHNLTGWPCVTLRVAATPEGLPIGMQIAAQPWCEGKALAVARYLESVFGGWKPSEALPAS